MKAGDKERQEGRKMKPQPQIYKGNLAVCANGFTAVHQRFRAALEGPSEKPRNPVICKTPALRSSTPHLYPGLGAPFLCPPCLSKQRQAQRQAALLVSVCLQVDVLKIQLQKALSNLPDLTADPAWSWRCGWRHPEVLSSLNCPVTPCQ